MVLGRRNTYLLVAILAAPVQTTATQIVRGEVADSLTETALADARVVLMDSNGRALDSTVTDHQGLFQFRTNTGLYQLRVQAASYRTSSFPNFHLVADDVREFRLLVPITTATGSAGISGVVASVSGVPIPNATILISSAQDPVRTDGHGLFRSLNLPPGSTIVHVRAIGFEGRAVETVLDTNQVLTLPTETFALLPLVTELEPIVVEGEAARTRRPLTEFWKRREHAQGHFMTRDEFMEHGSPQKTTDVLQRMGIVSGRNGLALRRTAARGGLRSPGQCPPLIFLDGRFLGKVSRIDIDTLLPLRDLAAVEAYTSSASMPLEFNRTGATCGVIVFWTQ